MDTDARPGRRSRPSRNETFAAAADLVSGGSGPLRRFARRYSLCAADADDAYQRGLEILLTKAPTTDRSELRAWLHTVIKHEALALRRQRERALACDSVDAAAEPRGESAPALDEEASGRERVRQTAEALAHLKPAEIQCLLLKALGYSYNEIADRTGYSWTKVNRSLTEGRRRFLERFGELSSGSRCAEFEGLLSAACDGESSASDNRRLRAHLNRCGSCRAALRGYRSAPSRLAELLPPGLLLPVFQQGGWWARLGDWIASNGGDRAGAVAWKVQQGAEALTAQKAAAVVASTAAIAGGAAVHDRDSHHSHRGSVRAANGVSDQRPEQAQAAPTPVVNAPTARPAPPARTEERDPKESSAAAPAGEFTPEASAAPAESSTTAPDPAGAAASSPRPARATAAGGGEFGP